MLVCELKYRSLTRIAFMIIGANKEVELESKVTQLKSMGFEEVRQLRDASYRIKSPHFKIVVISLGYDGCLYYKY